MNLTKLAVALSILALIVSGYALASTSFKSGSSEVCGGSGGLITCNGHDAPPPAKFGTCTPDTSEGGGILLWSCTKPR